MNGMSKQRADDLKRLVGILSEYPVGSEDVVGRFEREEGMIFSRPKAGGTSARLRGITVRAAYVSPLSGKVAALQLWGQKARRELLQAGQAV
ncbi:hypothetical protein [Pseudooceanicola algae]|uniref:Uncharacterized protein n=1 Tax=Pseudooceanicola algae TaxID=1537215 RepID=A0A418SKC4_9RHOB|nr:hypothetical protein [Pseudooceanicola algae]QPM89146.1 hypothetical protein PSAL_003570 [Pseudooceanicola algae]